MRHLQHLFIVLASVLMLYSCGQVGTISGGERDTTAPKILEDKVVPPMGSTNIFPQQIVIPFDEFIAFNKPAENIYVSPKDVKLEYKIKRKSLVLDVKEGEWEPNTTYLIYLYHAVKDITEENDSVMAYVFSTGDFIDSMQTQVKIRDAYTQEPVGNITVGLFEEPLENDTTNIKPRYFTSTNNEGIGNFINIKNEPFYLYAFEDENRNNRLDPNEKRAAFPQAVQFFDTIPDTIPELLLMPPEIQSTKVAHQDIVQNSGSWGIGFNRALQADEAFEFLDPQPAYSYWNSAKDSLVAFYKIRQKSGTFRGVFSSGANNDTISKRFFFKKPILLSIANNISQKKLHYADTLTLTFNDVISEMQLDSIDVQVLPEKDTVMRAWEWDMVQKSPFEVQFIFPTKDTQKRDIEKVEFSFPPNSFMGLNDTLKDSLKLDFTLQKERETGTMIVEFDTVPEKGILFILDSKNKPLYTRHFNGETDSIITIQHVQPGKYSFEYLIDKNGDGKWTTGSIFSGKKPERLIRFEQIATIRANWDVKTKLEFEWE